MGTRSLIAVVKDNEFKVAQYCQWDGYLDGIGCEILNFLLTEDDGSFIEKAGKCRQITEEEFNEQAIECGLPLNPDEQSNTDIAIFNEKFPWFDRDCAAKILTHIQDSNDGLKLSLYPAFAASGTCAWAYVIDLDTNMFEVYSGHDRKLTEEDRFYFLRDDPECRRNPIAIYKAYSLNDLPTEEEFINC